MVIQTSRIAGLTISAVSILLYELFAGSIIQLFISTATGNIADISATVAHGIVFLRSRCLSAPFAFMNFHITYTLQAMGDGKTTLILAALRQCLIYIPLMFLMNGILGANGLVWTQMIADIITLMIAMPIFKRKIKLYSQEKEITTTYNRR